MDHQARICHSTTVAGVANTWGYGAMTNSYNDIPNSRAIFLIGGNPAEAHPVSLLHVLKAKERNNAPLIVCDPRFTRTAAHADEYVRFRPGADAALIWGILWHIFENGWEDKEFIRTRVRGMDRIREEVAKWTPEEADRFFRNNKVGEGDAPLVEDITGEINRGMRTIGYTGRSPERIKLHMANQHTFDRTTLQAIGGPADGDYYGMPWPSWGPPETGRPGTPNLYDMSKPVAEGGLTFRARFGMERNGENLLAEGVYSVGSEIQDGYPEFTMQMLMDLGWDGDLTDAERAAIDAAAGPKTNWKTDLSGGIQRVALEHGCAPATTTMSGSGTWSAAFPRCMFLCGLRRAKRA